MYKFPAAVRAVRSLCAPLALALATAHAIAAVERFGLAGFGAHSNDAEYILVDSIEPRLYLAARFIIDLAQGKVQ